MKRPALPAIFSVLAVLLVMAWPMTRAMPAGGSRTKAQPPAGLAALNGPFDLAAERKPEVLHFIQESTVVQIGFDGRRLSTETVTLKLKHIPAPLTGSGNDEYVCGGVEIRRADGESVTLPALKDWAYVLPALPSGIDDLGQVFGIPHSRFEDLRDSRGRELSVLHKYFAYNSFIDFHAFIDYLARPVREGAGIQDLGTIGQRIVHAASGNEPPPTHLGSVIKEGSFFKNGEIVLVLKGLGLVDGSACAILGLDSGECTLKMIIPTGAGLDVVTVGGSRYIGDLHIDLATRWVRKVTLDEFIVTETRLPGAEQDRSLQVYKARRLLIRLVDREEYER